MALTYTFRLPAQYAGSPVTVYNTADVVQTTGTTDASGDFATSLNIGDYYATVSFGQTTYRASGEVDKGDRDAAAEANIQPSSTSRRTAQRGTLRAGVASRAEPSPSSLSAAGTNTQSEARVRHITTVPLVEVEIGFSNVYNNGGVETPGANNISVRAAIEYPANTFIPAFSSGGSRDITIEPGATGYLRAQVAIPAGAPFWSRNLTTVANNTMQFPIVGPALTANGEGATAAATITDHTTAAGITTGAGYGNWPSSIRAVGVDPSTLILAGVGDSIMDGLNDTDGHTGWWGRAFEGVAAYQRIAFPSERAQQFATIATRYRRQGLIVGCNVMVCGYGINDVNAARTLPQIQADLQAIWALGTQLGMKVFQHTITPKTTSSDSWATVGNQTVTANEAVRTQLNDWIRSVPAGLTGYIDMADTAESGRNSGKWKAASTADGTHPNASMYALMAATATAALPALTAATA